MKSDSSSSPGYVPFSKNRIKGWNLCDDWAFCAKICSVKNGLVADFHSTLFEFEWNFHSRRSIWDVEKEEINSVLQVLASISVQVNKEVRRFWSAGNHGCFSVASFFECISTAMQNRLFPHRAVWKSMTPRSLHLKSVFCEGGLNGLSTSGKAQERNPHISLSSIAS